MSIHRLFAILSTALASLVVSIASSTAQTETTINAGAIDLSRPAAAVVHYTDPYNDGSKYVIMLRYNPPCDPTPPILSFGGEHRPEFGDGPCIRQDLALKYGGRVSVSKDVKLNVMFTIPIWPAFTWPPAMGQPKTLLVRLGPETKVVPRNSASVEFKNVAGTNAQLEITVDAALFSGGGTVAIPVTVPGLLPLIINRF